MTHSLVGNLPILFGHLMAVSLGTRHTSPSWKMTKSSQVFSSKKTETYMPAFGATLDPTSACITPPFPICATGNSLPLKALALKTWISILKAICFAVLISTAPFQALNMCLGIMPFGPARLMSPTMASYTNLVFRMQTRRFWPILLTMASTSTTPLKNFPSQNSFLPTSPLETITCIL